MPIKHSTIKISKARSLRQRGESLRSVAQKVGIALSTAQLWTNDIELTKKQKSLLTQNHQEKLQQGRIRYAEKNKVVRKSKESLIFNTAITELPNRKTDSFFIAGLCLYWAEGFKKDHSLGFVNSDPFMMKLFLEWLKRYGEINEKNIRVRLQIHQVYKTNIASIQNYWSNFLQIPKEQFQRPYFQISQSNPNFIDPNYKGLLRIRVIGSRDFFVKILGWLEGLKKITL